MNKKRIPILAVTLLSLLLTLSLLTTGCSSQANTKEKYTEFINGDFTAWKTELNNIIQNGNEKIKPDTEKNVVVKELKEVIIPEMTELKNKIAGYKPASAEIEEIASLYESALDSFIEANANYIEFLETAKDDLYSKVEKNQEKAYAALDALIKKLDEREQWYAN